MLPGTQTIRFRRPQTQTESVPTVRKNRHAGILQDQLRRSQKAPWNPSLSLAFRLFVLVRVMAAMYANINDCDEVFNFWEPLHYLHRGHGFQTWETSPVYSIRSWAYILLHLWPAKLTNFLLGPEKRPAFFAIRVVLAFVSSFCEAFLYRTITDKINYRAGRYFLFLMLLNAGMWNASVSFLPSSFAMYANAIAFSYAMEPANNKNMRRALFATLYFATGALVGWPFALAVAIPFVFEELFLYGTDTVSPMQRSSWMITRWTRLIKCGLVSLLLLIPVVAFDTLFYGKLTIVPWNIVKYNVLPDAARGPTLYGSEPVGFYIHNLLLNMNVILPFALASLPALLVTHRIDFKRLGDRAGPERSSPYTLLTMRLAPMYVWFAIMFTQAHKEERFMYPVYPLICFNAAVTIYLIRGWMETIFIKVTKSPYRASKTPMFSRFTLSVVSASIILSASRIAAQWVYYHAPMSVVAHFEAYELPLVLNNTGLIRLPLKFADRKHIPENAEDDIRVDYDMLSPFELKLCYGKDWHRFPGNYLVPDSVKVEWIKSEFDGMLPGHFTPTPREGGLMDRLKGTHAIPYGLNDLNKEEPSFYVDVSTCDYLVDSYFPLHLDVSPLEPAYVADSETWERVKCERFLDARHSSLMTRTLWMPGSRWQSLNNYGEICLLKTIERMEEKERRFTLKDRVDAASLLETWSEIVATDAVNPDCGIWQGREFRSRRYARDLVSRTIRIRRHTGRRSALACKGYYLEFVARRCRECLLVHSVVVRVVELNGHNHHESSSLWTLEGLATKTMGKSQMPHSARACPTGKVVVRIRVPIDKTGRQAAAVARKIILFSSSMELRGMASRRTVLDALCPSFPSDHHLLAARSRGRSPRLYPDVVRRQSCRTQWLRRSASYSCKSRYTQIHFCAMYAVSVWDWGLCLPREWRFIWKTRWTPVKIAYLFCRYWVLAVVPYLLYCFCVDHPLDECERIFRIPVGLAIWNQVSAEVILLIRTYAFFNRNIYVLVLLVSALAGVVAYQLYVDTSQMLLLPFMGSPGSPGPCFPMSKPHSADLLGFFIAPLLYDTLVTVMTVVKAFAIRRRSGGSSSRLIQTFLREGVFYYILISIANLINGIFYLQPRQAISAICIPLSVMLSPVLACRLILDLRERGSETVAQSTGTMAFTAGNSSTKSTKSSPGSPFSGFGFGSMPRSASKVLVRPQGVVLSTMGSIAGDAMASASGLELDNLGALSIAKNPDLESGYPDDMDIGLESPVSGIRVDVEKTTMTHSSWDPFERQSLYH
ncbi:hypothetical protein NM688_g620 [Phlebia brevispora]|uniref:Uncharacterized protein n=1 Tax=Phlebia brevispora TaxID=194682 RepID=A0ACC1TDU4_9APHY|nr:hypothetical protein NM688_g620 [Phlebia brevispora]